MGQQFWGRPLGVGATLQMPGEAQGLVWLESESIFKWVTFYFFYFLEKISHLHRQLSGLVCFSASVPGT